MYNIYENVAYRVKKGICVLRETNILLVITVKLEAEIVVELKMIHHGIQGDKTFCN